jgi:hypothetical protein
MKRQGHLWDELTSFRNLLQAALKARRGKRRRANVACFEFHLEGELHRLQDDLRRQTYTPGPYRTFQITEPKPRLISAAPFRDRVVHHALCNILEPIFEPSFIFDSYGCRKGKDTHAAVDRFTQFIRRHGYVLKCDVSKYFPSIDHQILEGLIARKVKDRTVLWLVKRIIAHSNPQEPVQEWFAGDDLFSPAGRQRGLPLGNQTSQFFANVYLDPLDHFVKQVLRARCYLRYVDDFGLVSDDKGWLAEAREHCREFLCSLRLRLHPRKAVISRAEDGTRLLGYRVFPDHRLLPHASVTRMKRRLLRMETARRQGRLTATAEQARIASWLGHAGHADTFGLCGWLRQTIEKFRKTR